MLSWFLGLLIAVNAVAVPVNGNRSVVPTSERDVVTYINLIRDQRNIPPVRFSATANVVAERFVRDWIKVDEGCVGEPSWEVRQDWFNRMAEVGYRLEGMGYATHCGWSDPAEVVTSMVNGSYRDLFLEPRAQEIAVVYYYDYTSDTWAIMVLLSSRITIPEWCKAWTCGDISYTMDPITPEPVSPEPLWPPLRPTWIQNLPLIWG